MAKERYIHCRATDTTKQRITDLVNNKKLGTSEGTIIEKLVFLATKIEAAQERKISPEGLLLSIDFLFDTQLYKNIGASSIHSDAPFTKGGYYGGIDND